jgi:hypothetical protein
VRASGATWARVFFAEQIKDQAKGLHTMGAFFLRCFGFFLYFYFGAWVLLVWSRMA